MDSRETGSRCFTCSPQLPTHPCCTGAEQGRVLLSEEVEGVEGVGVGVREELHTHRYHVGAECSPQRGLGGGEG